MISHSPEVSNPTGYFLDSTGSSVTNRWFFPDIDPCICECHVWRDHWNWETIWECMETPQVRLNQRGLIDPSLAHDCTRMFRRLFQFSLNFCFSTDEFESNPRFHAYKLVQDHWLGKIVGFFFWCEIFYIVGNKTPTCKSRHVPLVADNIVQLNLMVGPGVLHRLCLKTSLIFYFIGVLMLQHKLKRKPIDVG